MVLSGMESRQIPRQIELCKRAWEIYPVKSNRHLVPSPKAHTLISHTTFCSYSRESHTKILPRPDSEVLATSAVPRRLQLKLICCSFTELALRRHSSYWVTFCDGTLHYSSILSNKSNLFSPKSSLNSLRTQRLQTGDC